MPLQYKKGIVLFLLSLSCAVCGGLQAQTGKKIIDSLEQALQSATIDTSRVELAFVLGRSLWFNRNIPEAVAALQQAIRLSDSARFYKYASDARLLLANACINLKQYDSAFSLLKQAMEIALRFKQDEHIPKINHAYSYLYNLLGDNKKGIEYGLSAIDGFEKSPLPEVNIQSVYAWTEMGRIFYAGQQYDKALEYFNKALQKARTSDKDWYVRPPLINIANIYVKRNQLDTARKIYREVIDIDEKDGGTEYRLWGLLGLGDISVLEKDFDAAIRHYKDALQLAQDRNMNTNVDDCLCKTGYCYLLNNQYDSAETYLRRGLLAARQSGGWNTINDSYKHLAELYEKKKNYSDALEYSRLHKETADSIYNKEKLTIINNLEALYQSNQKEKEIIRLQATNTEKQLELVKRNRLLWITGIAMAALMLVLLVYLRNSKNKSMITRQQQQLQHQKINSLEQEQKVIALKSMLAGQEAERARIAKDLHDGLGGSFSTVKMHLSTLQYEYEYLKHNELFLKSYRLVDTASEDLRRIAHNMMPEVLRKLGLVQALQDFCNTINAKSSFRLSLLNYGMEERLELDTEIMLYRVVQELINNIIKHARATEAIVQFNRNEDIVNITVEDNGCGFVPEQVTDKPHAGLDIIKSRVNYLNGNISIDSSPGIGTTVMIIIPAVKITL